MFRIHYTADCIYSSLLGSGSEAVLLFAPPLWWKGVDECAAVCGLLCLLGLMRIPVVCERAWSLLIRGGAFTAEWR